MTIALAEDIKRQSARAAIVRSPKVELFTAPELMALELPTEREIIPGVLHEGSTIFATRPKKGKTFFALGCALAVASGGRALGNIEVEQGDVLGLFLEDGPRRLRKRLVKMLGGDKAPTRLTIATSWPRLDEGGLESIGEWASRANDPRLVIVDTLKRIRPREFGHGRIYDLDYDAIQPLTDLAHRFGLALLTNHHCRKSASTDHIDDASGSLGLTGAADAVITLQRSHGEADAVLTLSSRDFDDREIAIKFDATICNWVSLGEAKEYALSKARRELIAYVTKNPGETPKTIAQGMERDYNATKKLLWEMAGDRLLNNLNGNYFPSS